jgi:hypothetical protein
MVSVEFLSARVMCLLWASFLDLYSEDGVCTDENVACLLCVAMSSCVGVTKPIKTQPKTLKYI